MADYTDPGLAIKKLAANVKAKMTTKADASALAAKADVSALAAKADASALTAKLDKPTGTGLKVWDATAGAWVDAPTPSTMTAVTDADLAV